MKTSGGKFAHRLGFLSIIVSLYPWLIVRLYRLTRRCRRASLPATTKPLMIVSVDKITLKLLNTTHEKHFILQNRLQHRSILTGGIQLDFSDPYRMLVCVPVTQLTRPIWWLVLQRSIHWWSRISSLLWKKLRSKNWAWDCLLRWLKNRSLGMEVAAYRGGLFYSAVDWATLSHSEVIMWPYLSFSYFAFIVMFFQTILERAFIFSCGLRRTNA